MTIGVTITDLQAYVKACKGADRELGKLFTVAAKDAANIMAVASTNALRSGGWPKAAKAIKPKGQQASAILRTVANPPWALGLIWGMKRRSGWYGARKYRDSAGKQFKPWVGNQYVPGANGGKPYFVGSAINAKIDEVVEQYLDALEEITRKVAS